MKLLLRALLLLAVAGQAVAQEKGLANLSVDDLMNVEVTSLARRGQKLSDVAAAVFVISREDIERSGATTIAEALRLAPGLDVASVDGNIWAVSARGFNGRWANRLLVMIDGRSVYLPMNSGVYWSLQDTMLEDIDRIEVIRGPGGTLWGANAVNGIINIITRNTLETQGSLATAGGGTIERRFAAQRYGGSAGDNFHFRVFAKAFDREGHQGNGPSGEKDGWQGGRAGFRADWIASHRDNVTAQAEAYRQTSDEVINFVPASDPLRAPTLASIHDSGGDALVRWTQTQSARSETVLQAYYDFALHPWPSIEERRRVFDLDFQHQLVAGSRNTMVWGLGYRYTKESVQASPDIFAFEPGLLHTSLASAFVQDEMRLPHDVRLTFGTKVQHDRFSGVQFQPTIRALWRANERHVFWVAATSAIRTPSWIELGAKANVGGFPGPDGEPVLITLAGDRAVRPERVQTYEVGYRWLTAARTSLDIATFYAKSRGIIDTEVGAMTRDAAGRLVLPMSFDNAVKAESVGVEVFATSQLTERLNLSGGYTWLHVAESEIDGDDQIRSGTEAPQHQLQLRSSFDISPAWELDTSAYYVGRLRLQGVPSYIRTDVRLAWHLSSAWQVSLVGQNLFDKRHQEFIGGDAITATPINRSIYAKVTWRRR